MSKNETLRKALGAIAVELRQRRAVDTEILNRLDTLIRMAGGNDSELKSLRDDHETHVQRVREHIERPLLAAGVLRR